MKTNKVHLEITRKVRAGVPNMARRDRERAARKKSTNLWRLKRIIGRLCDFCIKN